jgi:endoglucanase Acf2
MAFCSRTLDWTETDIYTAILHLLHKHNEQLELKTQKPKIQNNLVNHTLGDIKGLESKKLTIEQSSKRPIGFQHWRLL